MTLPFERLTIEQVARFPRPGAVIPANHQFTPSGDALTYLFSSEGSLARGLWRYDIATGARTLLAGPPPRQQLSREEELRRERLRLREEGVTDYAFARHAARETLIIPSPSGVRVSLDGGPFVDLPSTARAIDPQVSPDGLHIAFVRDGDLYVASVAGGDARRLTHDATDGLTNGLAEFIAQEELDRDHGFWWAPDSRRIAFVRADSRHIPNYPIVHQGLASVDIENHRYPFAGAANAVVQLAVVDIETRATSFLDLGPDPDIYLARVSWRPDGVLTAQVLSRDQKELALAAFQPNGPSILLHERSEPWYNLQNDLRFLESGEFLWSSERTGFRHIELRGASGNLLRQLTSGPWVVTGVLGVDEPRRLVYFQSTCESPVERHLYRVSLDGGSPERLTSEPGWHSGLVSKDGQQLLDVRSSRAHAPTVSLVHLANGDRTVLFANDGADAASLGLQVPEVVTLPAPEGDDPLFGLVYLPPAREPGVRYPVVVSVYGGPHAQRAIDEWSSTVDLRAQYLAQRGFVVFKLDNRGSANRGLAFEAPLYLAMGDPEVADQAAGVRWLGENYHYADTSRVGIYGWSYGGYMTLMCMAREPGVFHVGVAGAPVTHWDGYDTAYTERYMSSPRSHREEYELSSVMAHLGGFQGDLLVVHGMIDENVHFRHTARLLVELARLGKHCDTLIYPEERHMPRDPKGLEDHERRVLGFLEQKLRR